MSDDHDAFVTRDGYGKTVDVTKGLEGGQQGECEGAATARDALRAGMDRHGGGSWPWIILDAWIDWLLGDGFDVLAPCIVADSKLLARVLEAAGLNERYPAVSQLQREFITGSCLELLSTILEGREAKETHGAALERFVNEILNVIAGDFARRTLVAEAERDRLRETLADVAAVARANAPKVPTTRAQVALAAVGECAEAALREEASDGE
jgi:hypothetical protein